eukprot:TRINITY_DN8792_c0_g1_i2.p2 TRINITY_DN8792_c0_g1~~TRINITY_DN8792_c0_g1_i2.p2  ORF type:complete len:130 (-),score=34.08 TRINITY_DN8792_c0_g1_i2:268-657(-)
MDIVSSILEQVLEGMAKGPFWERENSSECMFDTSGFQQFHIDFKYALMASGSFLTDFARDLLIQIRERSTIHYCTSFKISKSEAITEFDVLEQNRIVKEALNTHRNLKKKKKKKKKKVLCVDTTASKRK